MRNSRPRLAFERRRHGARRCDGWRCGGFSNLRRSKELLLTKHRGSGGISSDLDDVGVLSAAEVDGSNLNTRAARATGWRAAWSPPAMKAETPGPLLIWCVIEHLRHHGVEALDDASVERVPLILCDQRRKQGPGIEKVEDVSIVHADLEVILDDGVEPFAAASQKACTPIRVSIAAVGWHSRDRIYGMIGGRCSSIGEW